MTPRNRLLLVALPLLFSTTAAFALTYPAVLDYQREKEELTKQETELADLKGKLVEKNALDNNRRMLQADIDNLRNEVPKAPYLDLLMLDLEKMAEQAQVDIIAVEKPLEVGAAGKVSADMADLETIEAATNKVTAANIAKTMGVAEKPGAKVDPPANSLGVKQMTRKLYLTGEYNKLVDFMKHLEAYQRVLAVKNPSIAIASTDGPQTHSDAGDRAQKMKLKEPVMSFSLNIYYLP